MGRETSAQIYKHVDFHERFRCNVRLGLASGTKEEIFRRFCWKP